MGQVVVKKGQKDLPPLFDNLLATGVTLTVVAPLMLLSGIDWGSIRLVWLYPLAAAILYMLYYYVLDKGKVSLTATLMSTYPAVTALLSTFILRDILSVWQIIAITMIILGTLLLDWKAFSRGIFNLSSWMAWGILGAVVIGIAEILTKIATSQTSSSTFTFLLSISYIPALVLCYQYDNKGREQLNKFSFKKLGTSLFGVALIELGLIPYNKAFSLGNAALVSAVSASRIVVTVVLAWFLLKEDLNKFQFLGVSVILTGVILSSL